MPQTSRETEQVLGLPPHLKGFAATLNNKMFNTNREEYLALFNEWLHLVNGIKPEVQIFDIWFGPTSTLFFLSEGTKRDTVALLNGDDLLDRFSELMKAKFMKPPTRTKIPQVRG